MKIRLYKPGDIDWIIRRHGEIYAEEYNWDESFEELVAEILANFNQHHEPQKERIWIAELSGEIAGSIMLVDSEEQIAQLRLLLVEPKARNKGIGTQLINECIDFSKEKGYKKIRLWTQSNLNAARHLYIKTVFKCVKKESHLSFCHRHIG